MGLHPDAAGEFPFLRTLFIEILILVLITPPGSQRRAGVERIKSMIKAMIKTEAKRFGHGHRAPSAIWQMMGCNFTPVSFS